METMCRHGIQRAQKGSGTLMHYWIVRFGVALCCSLSRFVVLTQNNVAVAGK